MKKVVLVLSLALVMVLALSVPARAHFQTIYTEESALDKGGEINLKMVFTHPFEAGHTMDMGAPLEFGVVHKEKKKDLSGSLELISFKSLTNEGKAYEADYKLRGMGDWVFFIVPQPYYEGSEDIYIQQITKTVVNVGGSFLWISLTVSGRGTYSGGSSKPTGNRFLIVRSRWNT